MSFCRFLAALSAVALVSFVPASHAQVGKADFLLLQHGLQVHGMVANYDVFHLSTYSNAQYTALHWLWDSTPAWMGAAPGFPWARWVRDETEMPPRAGESPYLSQLVAIQLGDEWNLNDDATRNRLVNWFLAVRSNWPNVLLFHNNYGGQVSDGALGDFITRAQPDLICFDSYPWRKDYATSNDLAGPPTGWYSDLRRYREHAKANRLPLGCYVQTFEARQDYDQTRYRNPSPSELRLNHSAALAFNAKVLIDFTYNTGASSLFDPPGDQNPGPLYAEKTDAARRARHLGRVLVRPKPIADVPFPDLHTTSMMIVRGRNAAGAVNPIPIGFVPDPDAPNSYTDWVADRNDPWLRGWIVTNLGTKNGGTNSDVLLAWFKPLDESLDGPIHTNQIYFMVVNGLTDPTGTAADCLQEIRLNFLNTFSAVEMLDPTTGQLVTNALPLVSTRRQLVLRLNGGDAALFKIANGATFVGITPIAPRLGVTLEGANRAIAIEGTIGSRHRLEAATVLVTNSWTPLTNLVLPVSPFVFLETASLGAGTRFYRAVLIP